MSADDDDDSLQLRQTRQNILNELNEPVWHTVILFS